MTRTKTGLITQRRHKKILRSNKGFVGSHSRLHKTANQEKMRSLMYAYKDRKKKKNLFRRNWIKQINNSAKEISLTYNIIINRLKKEEIKINRKILSIISILDNKTLLILLKRE